MTCVAKASDELVQCLHIIDLSPTFHIGQLTSSDFLATHSLCLYANLSLSSTASRTFGVSLGSPQVILPIFMVSITAYMVMRLRFPSLVLIVLLLSSKFL